MGRRREYMSERLRAASEVEHAHEEFLRELKDMPKGTIEERRQRREKYEAYPGKEALLTGVMQAYNSNAIEKLLRYTGHGTGTASDVSPAEVLFEPGIFYEALLTAVQVYTGITKGGNPYNFVACVGKIYSRSMTVTAAREQYQSGAPMPEVQDKWLPGILKLGRDLQRLQEMGVPGSLEELLDKLTEGRPLKGKKKEAVLRIARGENQIKSLNKPVGEESNREITMEDRLEDTNNAYAQMEQREAIKQMLDSFFWNWNHLQKALRKRDRQYVRIFMTKDILRELKLKEDGTPYEAKPAGDGEFYQVLCPHEAVLCGELFLQEYLCRAYPKKPENLYEIYAEFLRRDFDFSDKLLAETLGRDKSIISRWRTQYQVVRATLQDYCTAADI